MTSIYHQSDIRHKESGSIFVCSKTKTVPVLEAAMSGSIQAPLLSCFGCVTSTVINI